MVCPIQTYNGTDAHPIPRTRKKSALEYALLRILSSALIEEGMIRTRYAHGGSVQRNTVDNLEQAAGVVFSFDRSREEEAKLLLQQRLEAFVRNLEQSKYYQHAHRADGIDVPPLPTLPLALHASSAQYKERDVADCPNNTFSSAYPQVNLISAAQYGYFGYESFLWCLCHCCSSSVIGFCPVVPKLLLFCPSSSLLISEFLS